MRVASRMSAVVLVCTFVVFLAASTVRAAHSHPTVAPVSTVTAVLNEMRVTVPHKQVQAGKVTFVVRNAGTIEHELLVFPLPKTGKLTVARFRADEGASLGEVSELKPGKTGRVTLLLRPGRYLLICNLSGHYQLGMQTVIEAVSS